MQPLIVHLHQVPQVAVAVAELIHEEFWLTVPGASPEAMQARIEQATSPDRIPLCLVALHEGQVAGCVNLVDSDNDQHPEWSPWLAGMVVARPWRGQGVGSRLVLALLEEARRLQLLRVYFSTDVPRFYERLGAVHHQPSPAGFWFMRFDID